jgi:hypothetical protein
MERDSHNDGRLGELGPAPAPASPAVPGLVPALRLTLTPAPTSTAVPALTVAVPSPAPVAVGIRDGLP